MDGDRHLGKIMHLYSNRREAGRLLREELRERVGKDTCVLALPPGGVPVALEVVRPLRVPLDVIVVRKLGIPEHADLAMGALAGGGVQVLNEDVISMWNISSEDIAAASEAETDALREAERRYRRGRAPARIEGRDVVLIDDGAETGASMRAAIARVRRLGARHVTAAVAVAARETCAHLATEADAFICPHCLEEFHAIGDWYEEFGPPSDSAVRAALDEARAYADLGGSATGETSDAQT